MIAGGLIKSWSRSQRACALSSGEAELYAAVRCCQELLGVQALAKELGWEVKCNLLIDAKATLGMISRRGLGQLRHVEVQHLWIQDTIKSRRITVERVKSAENVADMMTKYVSPTILSKLMRKVGVYRLQG